VTVTTSRRPPVGLKTAGLRLWNAVVDEFVFDPGESELLRTTCHSLDELEALEAALAESPPMVTGSQGQPRPNPLLDEVRKHRETLSRLLSMLALPRDAARSLSELGSAAALARWKKTGTRRS